MKINNKIKIEKLNMIGFSLNSQQSISALLQITINYLSMYSKFGKKVIVSIYWLPVKNLKMEKSEDGIESGRVTLSTKTSRLLFLDFKTIV